MNTMSDNTARGWVSARNGKWHRATVAEPTFIRDESTACGLTFRPLNVTWHGERPQARAAYLCRRPGCADEPASPGSDIVEALTPWAKRNGIEPAALPALLNLVLLQQAALTAEAEETQP
jgi:hypothetical protein